MIVEMFLLSVAASIVSSEMGRRATSKRPGPRFSGTSAAMVVSNEAADDSAVAFAHDVETELSDLAVVYRPDLAWSKFARWSQEGTDAHLPAPTGSGQFRPTAFSTAINWFRDPEKKYEDMALVTDKGFAASDLPVVFAMACVPVYFRGSRMSFDAVRRADDLAKIRSAWCYRTTEPVPGPRRLEMPGRSFDVVESQTVRTHGDPMMVYCFAKYKLCPQTAAALGLFQVSEGKQFHYSLPSNSSPLGNGGS